MPVTSALAALLSRVPLFFPRGAQSKTPTIQCDRLRHQHREPLQSESLAHNVFLQDRRERTRIPNLFSCADINRQRTRGLAFFDFLR